MPSRHSKPSFAAQLIGYTLCVLLLVITIAGLICITVLAVKALWWVLTC